ncbi:quinone-dependent dihydroorotate dehydrogenase [Hyphomicrobium sp.]|uniref:quinone-dependent dihydroorotate dehydrogenase n=1 Tax=Hyphomicrobium sp. TaxID=82 RepID=UPI003F6FF645
MLNALSILARPMLLALEPEAAHELTLRTLELGLYPRPPSPAARSLEVALWGLTFPNPLGIAAGFDKDARVPDAVLGLGCGFAEIGTTTPKAQPGNPAPRVFRLVSEKAVINRLGFNNAGHAAALARLRARAPRGIVGVNIGANKDSADRIADYVAGLDAFYDVASYFTVNISSPNTPGLRDLQSPEALDALLSRIMAARDAKIAEGRPSRPVVVKFAPDIAQEDVAEIAAALLRHRVDGIAVSNTTLARPGAAGPTAAEAGGLSGRPLFCRATVMLARVYRATGGQVPLIGIGGIDSGETALAKIEAGATLLQLYTGLIYEGPGLIARIHAHLAKACAGRGVTSIAQLTGARSEEWAAKPLD